MFRKIVIIILALVVVALIAFAVKGNRGNPIAFQSGYDIRVSGPFESSNSTARYALTEAIVKNGTFELNFEQAKFASPDVVASGGKFFSIFTPGVSFAAVPFYLLGQYFSAPQLGAYFATALFAVANFFLVASLAKRLGASFWGSLFGAFAFTFATNALAYSQTLTQHHMSVTVVLLGILIAVSKVNFMRSVLFGFLCGVALLVDIPALILMIPAGLLLLSKIVIVSKSLDKFKLKINFALFGLLVGLIPVLIAFGMYNKITLGSYTSLAQSVGRTDVFAVGTAVSNRPSGDLTDRGGLLLPFDTREQMQGFYVLTLSDERSWLYYSPIVLIGILGLIISYRRKSHAIAAATASSVILLNIVLYTMFGDPWGGWSYGPRYLIPAAAILCSAVPLVLSFERIRYLLLVCVVALFAYSSFLSTLGVMTTNAIPPKVEAIALPQPIPHTPEYNLSMLEKNQSSSLIYNIFLSPYMNAYSYTIAHFASVLGIGLTLLLLSFYRKEKKA